MVVKVIEKSPTNSSNDLTAEYGYDDLGNMISAKDFNLKTTTWTYNSMGWLTGMTSPYSGTHSYVYDKNGNLIKHTTGTSHDITYSSYDTLGNAGSISYKNALNIPITQTLTYHATDLLDSVARNSINKLSKVVIKRNGSQVFQGEYAYDTNGNPTKYKQTIGTNAYLQSYSWNALGQIKTYSDPRSIQTTYAYDANRLNTMIRGGITIADYDYNSGETGDFGNVSLLKLANNQFSLEYKYYTPTGIKSDWIDLLTYMKGSTPIFTMDYANFDAMGNPRALNSTAWQTNLNIKYQYDFLNQLTQENYGAGLDIGYTYDKMGNRSSYRNPLGTIAYTYNATNGRLDSFTQGTRATTYGHDGNGNVNQILFKDGTATVRKMDMVFNDLNQLEKITKTEGLTTVAYNYEYDHQDRRISKTLPSGAIDKLYIWGLGNDIVAEANASGTITRSFIFSPFGQRLAMETDYTTTPKLLYFINDPQGSPIKLVSSTGNIVMQYATSPFGHLQFKDGILDRSHLITGWNYNTLTGLKISTPEIIKNDGAITIATINMQTGANLVVYSADSVNMAGGFDTNGQLFDAKPEKEAVDMDYTLTGHEFEEDSSLFYMQARWYDPVSGQFLSVDPAKQDVAQNPGSLNPYVYFNNNPIANIDPDGRKVIAAARDLNMNVPPWGTHQFIILKPDNPGYFNSQRINNLGVTPMRDLGDGSLGWVIGGHNVNGRLKVKFFESADFQATREYLNPEKYTAWNKPDFSSEGNIVSSPLTDNQLITNLLQGSLNYNQFEAQNPINYPKLWQQGTHVNSNSWAQSILKYAGGSGYKSDFFGLDASHQLKIDKDYFEPFPYSSK